MKGLPHADGMPIAYLPKERIVAYADMFNMPAPNATPAPPTAGHVAMVHAPNPDRPIKKADLMAAIAASK